MQEPISIEPSPLEEEEILKINQYSVGIPIPEKESLKEFLIQQCPGGHLYPLKLYMKKHSQLNHARMEEDTNLLPKYFQNGGNNHIFTFKKKHMV